MRGRGTIVALAATGAMAVMAAPAPATTVVGTADVPPWGSRPVTEISVFGDPGERNAPQARLRDNPVAPLGPVLGLQALRSLGFALTGGPLFPDLLLAAPRWVEVRDPGNPVRVSSGSMPGLCAAVVDAVYCGVYNTDHPMYLYALGDQADVWAPLTGTVPPSYVHGNAGDDDLRGASYMDGGDGADRLQADGSAVLHGDADDDALIGGAGNDRLDGGAGDDEVAGGSGHDSLSGGSGDDQVTGGPGADVVSSGGGADQLLARDGEADRVFCDDADDVAVVDVLDTFPAPGFGRPNVCASVDVG